MPGDDRQVRELERHVVEVGDRPPRLRWLQRPRVTRLQAERHAKLRTLGVDRIVAAVVRGQVPEPGDNADRLEAELLHAAPHLSHGFYRPGDVHGADADETIGGLTHEAVDLVVADEEAIRAVPGADETDVDAGAVHRGDRELDRDLLIGRLHLRPAPQRIEHLVLHEAQGRVLHPDVDYHSLPPLRLAAGDTQTEL